MLSSIWTLVLFLTPLMTRSIEPPAVGLLMSSNVNRHRRETPFCAVPVAPLVGLETPLVSVSRRSVVTNQNSRGLVGFQCPSSGRENTVDAVGDSEKRVPLVMLVARVVVLTISVALPATRIE